MLREGDKVTFGHPCGARLPAGSKSRQPDSDNQFMVLLTVIEYIPSISCTFIVKIEKDFNCFLQFYCFYTCISNNDTVLTYLRLKLVINQL